MNKRIAGLCMVIFFAGLVQAYTTIISDTLSSWLTHGTSFNYVLIDVRDSSEIDQVTPADSCIISTEICRPYNLSYNLGVFDQKKTLLIKTVPVIVYCRSGSRSGNAAKKLDSMGFSSVYTLSGGFSSWKGPKKPHSYVKPTSLFPQLSYTKSSIRDNTVPVIARNNAVKVYYKRTTHGIITLHSNKAYATYHEVGIVTLKGEFVASKVNPFATSTSCVLPGSFSDQHYGILFKSRD